MGRLRRRATIARKGIAQILETAAEHGFHGEEWLPLARDTQGLARALKDHDRPETMAQFTSGVLDDITYAGVAANGDSLMMTSNFVFFMVQSQQQEIGTFSAVLDPPSAVPEPASLALLSGGLLMCWGHFAAAVGRSKAPQRRVDATVIVAKGRSPAG